MSKETLVGKPIEFNGTQLQLTSKGNLVVLVNGSEIGDMVASRKGLVRLAAHAEAAQSLLEERDKLQSALEVDSNFEVQTGDEGVSFGCTHADWSEVLDVLKKLKVK